MCGRFDLNQHQLEIYFGVDLSGVAEYGERIPAYNIAPTDRVLTVISGGQTNYPRFMRWGLVPRWSKEISSKYTMINARDDQILQRRAYTGPFKNQRCLIPASGFYEWRKGPNRSRWPVRFTSRDGEPFAFAGIWERARPGGEEVLSCSIITTSPNELCSQVHDRMPVILPPGLYGAWMDPEEQDAENLLEMLQPYDPAMMRAYPVSQDVNAVRNKGSSLIEAVGPDLMW